MINQNPITNIDQLQIAWAVITLLIVVLGFFIRSWINTVNKNFDNLVKKLDCKQDKALCADRYPRIQDDISALFKHKHPLNEGTNETGSVVIP